MEDNMRVVFHVRCHGQPDDELEDMIMAALADVVTIPEKGWGILTIGRSYYHDNSLCNGHPDAEDKCNAN